MMFKSPEHIIGTIAAFCTTASFLPQAIKTIKTQNTNGISLEMYTLFTIGVLLWLVYGILLKELEIIVANAITSVFAGIILAYVVKNTLFSKKSV